MPGYRRRRTYRPRINVRPQPWRQSVNGLSGTLNNDAGQTDIRIVDNESTIANQVKILTVSGIRVQMAVHYSLAGAGIPVYWAIQYCPNDIAQSLTPASGTQLLTTEQFLMASGVFMANEVSQTIVISSPLMRKLYSNDSIVLSLRPADNPGTDPITFAATIRCFIK